jgi:hypothetical protein
VDSSVRENVEARAPAARYVRLETSHTEGPRRVGFLVVVRELAVRDLAQIRGAVFATNDPHPYRAIVGRVLAPIYAKDTDGHRSLALSRAPDVKD